MNKSAWIKAFWVAVLCVPLLPVRAAWGQPKSAYEKLDPARLAKTLRAFEMNELLAELVKSGKGTDTKSVALLVQARIATAEKVKDQAGRDKLLDEAIALLDELIEATAGAGNDNARLQHYRFTLDRVVTEGFIKTVPYVERLMYFQDKPGDAETVAKLTKSAVRLLDHLTDKTEATHRDWGNDEDRMVTGALWRLEPFIREVRYRGAWIRTYRAIVLPGDSDERTMLLQQAIADVDDFAGAEDNSSGVKFDSLLLSGMCARMLGEWRDASGFLKRASDKNASDGIRLKAYFEMVVCLIDQKKFTESRKAIEDFTGQAGTLKMQKVAVDLQATLLKNRLLEVQAENIKQEDPAKADKLLEESRKILLDFVEKYPACRDQIMEIVVGKYEGADTKNLPPGVRALLGVKEFTKAVGKVNGEKTKTPDFARAEKIFTEMLDDKRSGGSGLATALWYMGHIRNIQRSNRKAARYFIRLVENFPEDKRAKDSAMNAVKSLRGIVTEKGVPAAKLGREFVEQYAHCLEVLVGNWGEKDPKIRSYNYELAKQYDALGRNDDAMDAFNKIDPHSELYLPSRSRILSLQARNLLNSADKQEIRYRLAVNLIRDLRSYCRRARKFASETPDKNRKIQVLKWGAQCDMVIAQILKDVLNQPAQSITHAEKVPHNWPEIPGLNRQSQEFIIRILLEDGRTAEAVAKLLKLVEQNPTGAERLVAKAIDQIHVRTLRLELRCDQQSQKKLADLRKAYRVFAEKLYTWASNREKPFDMYDYERALAIAYTSSDNVEEVKKARNLFERLDKKKSGQAINVLGLARCLVKLKNNTEAMKQYDRLITGLKHKSAHWWRAHLEQLQLAVQIYDDNAKGLESIGLQIRVLRGMDSKMGEYRELFGAVEDRAGELLKTIREKTGE